MHALAHALACYLFLGQFATKSAQTNNHVQNISMLKALLCSMSVMLMKIGLLQGSVTHNEIQLTRHGLSY